MAETATLDTVTTTETLTTVLTESEIQSVQLSETSIGVVGPPGPPGDTNMPDASTIANGRMLAVLDGAYVDVPPPAGTGDMHTLIYDPRGVSADAFIADNLTGIIDGGRFT